MFPNNVSSQWYAAQERTKRNSPALDSDGIPLNANSFQPHKSRLWIFKLLSYLGKRFVSTGKFSKKANQNLLEPPLEVPKKIRSIMD